MQCDQSKEYSDLFGKMTGRLTHFSRNTSVAWGRDVSKVGRWTQRPNELLEITKDRLNARPTRVVSTDRPIDSRGNCEPFGMQVQQQSAPQQSPSSAEVQPPSMTSLTMQPTHCAVPFVQTIQYSTAITA